MRRPVFQNVSDFQTEKNYGLCSILVSLTILIADLLLKGPVGLVLSFVLLAAILLGAPIGIGPLLCTLLAGFLFQMVCGAFRFDPKSVN